MEGVSIYIKITMWILFVFFGLMSIEGIICLFNPIRSDKISLIKLMVHIIITAICAGYLFR